MHAFFARTKRRNGRTVGCQSLGGAPTPRLGRARAEHTLPGGRRGMNLPGVHTPRLCAVALGKRGTYSWATTQVQHLSGENRGRPPAEARPSSASPRRESQAATPPRPVSC